MNYEQAYRRLISGQTAGLSASILRLFLTVPAVFYSIVIGLRNFLYSRSWLKTAGVGAAVISVGNITIGGTGKTPLVIRLCKFLREKNINCAVLTRGYKTKNQKRETGDERRATRTDEPAILAESCPTAKVIVNPDRLAGAAEAVNKFGAKVLIMDDGFQHRRLNRDLDIVTIDATLPFGYGRMLPAGLLREPPAALKRADAVVITRCDQADDAQLAQLEEKLKSVNPDMIIARSIHTPVCARSVDNEETSIEQLKDKKIFAFCGIGNPDAFLDTVRSLSPNLLGSKVYNDHHHYADNDIADIYKQAERLKADLILTTQKDWSRLPIADFQSKVVIPFAYLAIELKFTVGEDRLKRLIEYALADKILQN